MNTSAKAQRIEADVLNGLATLVIINPTGEVRGAGPAGEGAGEDVLNGVVDKAISSTVRRARELLAVVTSAAHKETEFKEKLKMLERERTTAPAVMFGPALTARLAELTEQHSATKGLIHAAEDEREEAVRQLENLRDTVTETGPVEVRKAVRDRIKAATAERQKAADALAAVLAPYLAALLQLDAEVEALEAAKPTAAVKQTLVAELAEVFGPAGVGLVGTAAYDPADVRPDPQPISGIKFRVRGREADYGISDRDDRWERDE